MFGLGSDALCQEKTGFVPKYRENFTDIVLLCIVLVYAGGIVLTNYFLGGFLSDFIPVIMLLFTGMGVVLLYVPLFIVCYIALRSFYIYVNDDSQKSVVGGLEYIESSVLEFLLNERFIRSVILIIALFLFHCFFCFGKSLLPHLSDYTWDPFFSEIDRIVHFGFYPHEIFNEFMGNVYLYQFLNFVYWFFFPCIMIVCCYVIFLERDQLLQKRFMWSYVGTWIIAGNFFAMMLTSTGPIFYEKFYDGFNPYESYVGDLLTMARARERESFVLLFWLREELYEWVTNGTFVDLNAISAMPSLHVSIVALFLCYFWRRGGVLRCGFIMLWMLTVMSTVYLGFHYAIDGYFGTVVTVLIWKGSSVLSFFERKRE